MSQNKEIEEKIEKAVNNATPNLLENILSRCNDQKGNVIYMTEAKERPSFGIVASIAAAVILMIGTIVGVNYKLAVGVDSTVFLDVNPSIQLSVNKNERILEAEALNEDAKSILEGMNLKNTDLDVGINSIIGSMLKKGYLSDISNSILVSVENDDKQKSEKLKEHLADEISEILNVSSVSAAVLSQSVKENSEVKKLSEDYGISKGKSELILAIIAKNPDMTVEKLVGLTINELNLLMNSNKIELPEVTKKGEPSVKSYITREKAKVAALKAANVKEENLKSLKIVMDTEDGQLVYEVVFKTDKFEYEYKINATDASVLEYEIEKTDEKQNTNGNNNQNKDDNDKNDVPKANITVEKVREIVLKAANLTGKKVGLVNIELDYDDGVLVYEAEFHVGNDEYSYVVNANTGEILDFEIEKKSIDNFGQNKKDDNDDNDDYDDDDDEIIIKIPKKDNGNKKDEIKIGIDLDDIKDFPTPKITLDKVKEIVLKHADLDGKKINKFDVEMEYEDGVLSYVVEIKAGNNHYNCVINALTGEFIE